MKYKKCFPSILLLVLFALLLPNENGLAAQRRKTKKVSLFRAGVLVGGNLAQIDGDRFMGFDRAGIYAGGRGIVSFTNDVQIRMELLYSQKGNQVESRTGGNYSVRDRGLRLNYVEAPIIFHYKLPNQKESGLAFEIGFSYARLSGIKIEEDLSLINVQAYAEIEEDFVNNDFSAVVGIAHHFSPKMEMGFRGTWGVVKFYNNSNWEEERSQRGLRDPVNSTNYPYFRNYMLSGFVAYNF